MIFSRSSSSKLLRGAPKQPSFGRDARWCGALGAEQNTLSKPLNEAQAFPSLLCMRILCIVARQKYLFMDTARLEMKNLDAHLSPNVVSFGPPSQKKAIAWWPARRRMRDGVER